MVYCVIVLNTVLAIHMPEKKTVKVRNFLNNQLSTVIENMLFHPFIVIFITNHLQH